MSYSMTSTLGELSATRTGRLMQKMMERQLRALAGPDAEEANVQVMLDAAAGMNLEQLVAMSQGRFPQPLVTVVLASANGKPLSVAFGLVRLIPFGLKQLRRPKAA